MPIRQYTRKVRAVIIRPGPSTAYVRLTQGQFALIDKEDAELVGRSNWCALWCKYTNSYYALGYRKGEKLKLQRFILGLTKGDPRQGDHANTNTLDYRRANLRMATLAQNRQNCRKNRKNTSGYKGVHRGEYGWIARIKASPARRIYLGCFSTPEAAHAAYCAAALKYHGEFARVA